MGPKGSAWCRGDERGGDRIAVGGRQAAVLAGSPTGGRTIPEVLAPGQAIGIATGAPVPVGADAVVPVERVVRSGVTVVGEVRGGQHVRRAGEDCAGPGDVVAHPRDTRLVPVSLTGSGAMPVGHDRPGTLWGAALADALAVVPPGWAGDQVELLHLYG
jgi:molybdopterin biosynthesis enzyme